MMTNVEKSREIAHSYEDDKISVEDVVIACMGMSKWKDEQNEEKELVLKDLCARLPYNEHTYSPSELRKVRHFDYHELIPMGLDSPKDK